MNISTFVVKDLLKIIELIISFSKYFVSWKIRQASKPQFSRAAGKIEIKFYTAEK